MAPGGLMWVALAGLLTGIRPDGTVAWTLPLMEDGQAARYHSAPVALADNTVVLTLQASFVVVDTEGTILGQVPVSFGLDDTGPSPNVTPNGELVLSSLFG
ncbi:MAG TPA: hypothetical protein VM536_00175, partial [Chloroflexia bacterium]|nr:hypothetical protein [Chloroflexia bacterium]